MRISVLAASAATLALLSLSVPFAPSAAAANNGSWSILPTPSGSAGPAGPAPAERFELNAVAGQKIHNSVTITNLTHRPITFLVYGADAYNTPTDGGFALRTVREPERDLGAWTQLAKRRVTVAGQRHVNIPFTVTVPRNATPGDHIGGIVALNTAVETLRTGRAIRLGVQRAVGVRIYLHVAGTTTPSLAVRNVRIDRPSPIGPFFFPRTGMVHYQVVNTGNTALAPSLTVSATNLFGHTTYVVSERRLPQILPGQAVNLSARWPSMPSVGPIDVSVDLTADPQVTASQEAHFTAMPWPTIGVLLLLAVAVFALWYWRRRRRQDAAANGEPDEWWPTEPEPPMTDHADLDGTDLDGTEVARTEVVDSPVRVGADLRADR